MNSSMLKLWIPDTIISADGDYPPMWFYSSDDGYVFRTDNFIAKNIENKIAGFGNTDELVGVLKKVCIYFYLLFFF